MTNYDSGKVFFSKIAIFKWFSSMFLGMIQTFGLFLLKNTVRGPNFNIPDLDGQMSRTDNDIWRAPVQSFTLEDDR